MNSHPLVSIIIPVYNVEKYVDKCIKSVISQSYKNIEIIVVDDGSTDKSREIVDCYKKYKNVKVFHKENGGLSSARNYGLKHATGEWYAFVDSDDYICDSFVAELITTALKNNADIATCSLDSYSDDGAMLKKAPCWPEGIFNGNEFISKIFENKYPAYIWLSIYRARLFKDNNILFPDGREYEDISTRIKLTFFANKVTCTNKKLYHYLSRKDSITGRIFSKKKHDDFNTAVSDVEKFLSSSKYKYSYLEYFKFYTDITQLNYLAKERKPYSKESSQCWCVIKKELFNMFFRTKFPTLKLGVMYGLMMILSLNRPIYSIVYRKIKNE